MEHKFLEHQHLNRFTIHNSVVIQYFVFVSARISVFQIANQVQPGKKKDNLFIQLETVIRSTI